MNNERTLTPAEEEQIRAEVRRELTERQEQDRQRREERMQREQEKTRAQEIERIRRDEEARFLATFSSSATASTGAWSGSRSGGFHRRRRHSRMQLTAQHMKELVFTALFLMALTALYIYNKM